MSSQQHTSFFNQPFSIQWRKALVSAPRLVPIAALKYTSAEGPHPFILNLPSRGKYLIPCYVFVPPIKNPDSKADGLPVVIDFHGGGFVLGSCLEQGPFCAKMARELEAVVICVDYRMGPIDKFPAAIEDGEDVLSAVLEADSPAGKELRAAIEKRLSSDEKKALRKANKAAKKQYKHDTKAQRKQERKELSGMRPKLGHRLSSTVLRTKASFTSTPTTNLSASPSTSSLIQESVPVKLDLRRANTSEGSSLAALARQPGSTSSLQLPASSAHPLSQMQSNTSSSSLQLPSPGSHPLSTMQSNISTASSLALGPIPILDPHRIALSGFSSGGNLVLNLALSIPASEPFVPKPWPSRFPVDYPTKIPLLLYYPSLDCRQLPSERTRPKGLEAGGGFWSEANDLLMPTYLPRDRAGHPRASPGLAELKYGGTPGLGLHDACTMHLVLPELDTLSEQSEMWVEKVKSQGRADDLFVDRYKGMKHGWTQMPESWLSADARKTRLESYENSLRIVREAWDTKGRLSGDESTRGSFEEKQAYRAAGKATDETTNAQSLQDAEKADVTM